LSPFDTEAVFKLQFELAVKDEVEASGFPTDQWFQAGRGETEGYDWWMANGPRLVQNFIDWYEARDDVTVWIAPDGTPAIELPVMLDFGTVPVRGYIDLVLAFGKVNPALVVMDFKSGTRKPDNPRQLAIYANAIERTYGIRPRYGSYFMNRGGRSGTDFFQQPIEMNRPSFDFGYLSKEFEMFDLAVQSGIFPANPGDHCRRCGVAYACAEVGGEQAHKYDPNYRGGRR
jgi:putative RecB family exonuclease